MLCASESDDAGHAIARSGLAKVVQLYMLVWLVCMKDHIWELANTGFPIKARRSSRNTEASEI